MISPRSTWLLGLVLSAVAVALLALRWRRRREHSVFLLLAVVLPPALVVLACGIELVLPHARLPLRVRFNPLAALPLAAAVLVLWLRGPELERRLGRGRARVHAVLVGAALGLAGLLLAEAEGLTWKNDQIRVVVWDVSRSAERAGVTALRRDLELRLAEQSMRSGDRIALVEVGGRAELAVPVHAKGTPAARLETAVPRDATDLEAGVRRALAELPAEVAAKVVLVSDGVENHGDVLRAVAPARARGIPIDTMLVEYAPPADLELHAVRAPSRAATSQPFDLRVETSTGSSAEAASGGSVEAELVIERDGVAWQKRQVHIAQGHDVLQVPIEETEAGFHRYSVELRGAAGNEIHDNDEKTAFVEVSGARSALVLSGVVPGPPPIAGWLRDAGFQVKLVGPSDLVDDVADFSAKDLIVLEDVPAATLGDARIRALSRAVSEVGVGLLLIGGKHAFGPGGYAGSPLEAVSPVSFDLKKDKNRPPLAEVIVIDYSGSMSAPVGGQTKIALANEAAARSAGLLSPGDRVAVAHVDTEVKWTIPLSVVEDGKVLAPKIRAVEAGGGGIYSQVALQAAYGALRTVPTGTLKHVLLFADGDDAEEITNCPAMAAAAARSDITTSVVSLGRGTDSAMLERTSTSGGGRFYLVEDARTLPEVFSQETVLASRRAFREERISPKIVSDSSFLRGVTALPDLDGYVVTMEKPGARTSLVGAEDEPLVVDWARGVGKVGALTTDLSGLWSSGWIASENASRLTAQLAVALARSPTPPGARLVTTQRRGEILIEASDSLAVDPPSAGVAPQSSDDATTLVARIVSPDGTQKDVPLEEVARGAFEGHVRPDGPGTHVVTLLRRRHADPPTAGGANSGTSQADGPQASDLLIGRSAIVLGSSDELAPRPSNRALLERLASETSGNVRTTLESLFEGERRYYTTQTDLSFYLLVALAALLVVVVATRRLVLPSLARRPAPAGAPILADEIPTLALARRAKAARPAPPSAAAHQPLVAKPTPAGSQSPPQQPEATAPSKQRELTAVERIAQRRRDSR